MVTPSYLPAGIQQLHDSIWHLIFSNRPRVGNVADQHIGAIAYRFALHKTVISGVGLCTVLYRSKTPQLHILTGPKRFGGAKEKKAGRCYPPCPSFTQGEAQWMNHILMIPLTSRRSTTTFDTPVCSGIHFAQFDPHQNENMPAFPSSWTTTSSTKIYVWKSCSAKKDVSQRNILQKNVSQPKKENVSGQQR